ncbi:MAG: transcription antitermination factor NusB, partial [Bacteroidales bacterium]|nr:transcription antitermination factor NusB [Bacteroidales bacterium]
NEIQDISSFANKLLDLTIKHFNEFDELIKVKALNWDFERIAIMDKLILRLAVCELLYFPEIPPKVSIDEAIEISKKYSTEKSGKFVNGILDSILTELRQSKRLKKKGRGLKNGKISKTELL